MLSKQWKQINLRINRSSKDHTSTERNKIKKFRRIIVSRYRSEKCGEEGASQKKTHNSNTREYFNKCTCVMVCANKWGSSIHRRMKRIVDKENSWCVKFMMHDGVERERDILRKSIGNDICTRDPWCMTFMMYELKKIHRGNISICFMIMTCKKHCLAKYASKRVKSYRMAFCFTDIKGRFYPFNLQTWKINVSWWIETRSRSKSVLLCISLFSSCLIAFYAITFSRILKLDVWSIDIVEIKLKQKISISNRFSNNFRATRLILFYQREW